MTPRLADAVRAYLRPDRSDDAADPLEALDASLAAYDAGTGAAPTAASIEAELRAEVGDCCRGADPYCAAGCLVAEAVRRRGLAPSPDATVREAVEAGARAMHMAACCAVIRGEPLPTDITPIVDAELARLRGRS